MPFPTQSIPWTVFFRLLGCAAGMEASSLASERRRESALCGAGKRTRNWSEDLTFFQNSKSLVGAAENECGAGQAQVERGGVRRDAEVEVQGGGVVAGVSPSERGREEECSSQDRAEFHTQRRLRIKAGRGKRVGGVFAGNFGESEDGAPERAQPLEAGGRVSLRLPHRKKKKLRPLAGAELFGRTREGFS